LKNIIYIGNKGKKIHREYPSLLLGVVVGISHNQLAASGTYVGAAGGRGGAAGATHGLNGGGGAAVGAGPSSATPVRGLLLL
jgi:hypothetical protein